MLRDWIFERDDWRHSVCVDGWLVSDSRIVLDGPLQAGHLVMRLNDLTAQRHLADGSLQPALLDWTGLNAPPLSLVVRRPLARQPRMRAWVDFTAEHAARLAAARPLNAIGRYHRQRHRLEDPDRLIGSNTGSIDLLHRVRP